MPKPRNSLKPPTVVSAPAELVALAISEKESVMALSLVPPVWVTVMNVATSTLRTRNRRLGSLRGMPCKDEIHLLRTDCSLICH